MRLILGFGVAIVLATACGSSNNGGGTGGSTSTSTGSGQTKCFSVKVNETNDGATPCGPKTCAGNTYCLQNSGICNQGCHSELECPAQQTCDQSNGAMDESGKPIGLCRVPNATETIACPTTTTTTTSTASGTASCMDICFSKGTGCGAPADVATTKCKELCAVATPDQVTCLEGKSCTELGDAFSHGTTICGL